MKREIGSTLALYPTPVVVVGALVNGKVNWALAGHVGIIGHDRILVSLHNVHFTNQGIRETGLLSLNIVDEALLPKADYVGSVSGAKVDKSQIFACHPGRTGTPIVEAAPLAMECQVVDNYRTETFDNFICKIAHTYAEESILTAGDKIDYDKLKPILFEMPTYSYFRTGDFVAKCKSLGKKMGKVVPSLTLAALILFSAACAANSAAIPGENRHGGETEMALCEKLPQTEQSMVRLARLKIDPAQLDAYRAAAIECGETSLRTEPGVLAMYAVAEKDHPTEITILEIYADAAAYEAHLQTEHFQKYKIGTKDMVESLELIDTQPLNPSIYLKSMRK